ncbi:hypothetical protein MRX96_052109 [Rhipicephalus microplus]
MRQGLNTVCGAGDARTRHGVAVHVYCCNISMKDKAMYNSDGDFLIGKSINLFPQQGSLNVVTEFGRMHVEPNEICVIQQGMRFQVYVSGPSRGYVLEVFDNHFVLPNLGPIGANGLANPRDFKTPTAWYEDRDVNGFLVVSKYQACLFQASQNHSPFDVVAWHGNYVPYKYDLFQVQHRQHHLLRPLRPLDLHGAHLPIDQAGHGHRRLRHLPTALVGNCMSEFMGLITGKYEAKETGFQCGGASLHSMMTPHGPDVDCFEQASKAKLAPQRIGDGCMAWNWLFGPLKLVLAHSSTI